MWPTESNFKKRVKTNAFSNKKEESLSQNSGDKDPNQDNSLLNKNNKIKGKIIPLENYQVSDSTPSAGVYCIYCKENSKHYVGESMNLKDRFMEHFSQLLKGIAGNSTLQSDFNKYGPSSFEFIVHNTDESMVDFDVRLALQNALQLKLISLGLCYNTGLNETVNPRSNGQWPSQAGICVCVCNETNTYYMSGTLQRTGVRGRAQSMRSALRRGEFTNAAMQKDWFTYGEKAFELIPYDFGTKFDQMSNKEISSYTQGLISKFVALGYGFYNDKNSLLNPVSNNLPAIKAAKDFEANVDLYNPPKGPYENKLPINMANRICLVAETNTYLSVLEAANCLGVNENVIKDRLKVCTYREATREEILTELLRRNWSNNKDLAVVNLPKTRTTKGIPVPVEVNGIIYRTLADAARAENITPKGMEKRIRNNTPGHRKLTPEEFEKAQQQNQ